MKTFVIGYVPVIHNGYVELFRKYGGDESSLYVFGEEIVDCFRHLRKDVRAAKPEDIVKMARSLEIFGEVCIASPEKLKEIPEKGRIVMPNENISKVVARKYFPDRKIIPASIFLRWDKDAAKKKHKIDYDYTMSYAAMAKDIMDKAYEKSKASSDWWRHVGAVAVKNDWIMVSSYNHHLPSEHTPYIVGDPRGEFHKGIHIELSSAIHAEAALISAAAERGISLAGADLYVTTFPCPPCAGLIAYSGIRRVFFHEGYSMLDAKKLLNSFGIKVVYVK